MALREDEEWQPGRPRTRIIRRAAERDDPRDYMPQPEDYRPRTKVIRQSAAQPRTRVPPMTGMTNFVDAFGSHNASPAYEPFEAAKPKRAGPVRAGSADQRNRQDAERYAERQREQLEREAKERSRVESDVPIYPRYPGVNTGATGAARVRKVVKS